MKRKFETPREDNLPDKYLKKNEEMVWEKFSISNFCEFRHDDFICNPERNLLVSPKISGSRLVADYYSVKYGCNIEFALKSPLGEKGSIDNLLKNLKTSEFSLIRNANEDYRKAFLLGMDNTHGIPVIYIKEGNFEGILIANSLGATPYSQRIAENISANTQIDVYMIAMPRQVDMYSCYTDALVFARDATGFCTDKSGYYIPNLLTFLKEASNAIKQEKPYFETRLPNELLKTCQTRSFLDYHQQKSQKFIHNNQTLDVFRTKYTDKGLLTKYEFEEDTSIRDVYSYPRKKGLKFVAMMTVQFYLNQLDSATGITLALEQKLDFIQQAKIITIKVFGSQKRDEKLIQLIQSFITDHQKSQVATNCSY